MEPFAHGVFTKHNTTLSVYTVVNVLYSPGEKLRDDAFVRRRVGSDVFLAKPGYNKSQHVACLASLLYMYLFVLKCAMVRSHAPVVPSSALA
jgi:hypothetical protein